MQILGLEKKMLYVHEFCVTGTEAIYSSNANSPTPPLRVKGQKIAQEVGSVVVKIA